MIVIEVIGYMLLLGVAVVLVVALVNEVRMRSE